MSQKKYRGNKYIHCYCSKSTEFMLGMELYKYVNPAAWLGGLILTGWVILGGHGLLNSMIVLLLLGLPSVYLPSVYLPLSNYRDVMKKMTQWGHAEYCSQRIARMRMLRASLWSEFKVFDTSSNTWVYSHEFNENTTKE